MAKGPVPISLRSWYEQVGSVSFEGAHAALNPDGNETIDPLVVRPLEYICRGLVVNNIGGRIHLNVAPNAARKAGVLRGTEYRVVIPNAGADVRLENEPSDGYFVSYLRRAFQWGGFPGWARAENPPAELIARVTEGLLPI